MKRSLLFSRLAGLAILSGAFAMTASAQTPVPQAVISSQGTLLSISAQAEAAQAPDIASISVGVVTESTDSAQAMRDNATRMNAVLAAIGKLRIADKDVQTSGVNLYPQHRYVRDEAPQISGYQASNTVTVKVRDLSRLGEVMDALAGQGANQIHGPNFQIDNPEPLYDKARLAALDKARQRAKTYADALGARVLRIVSIGEGGGGYRPVPMMAMAKSADMAESTPIAPGENTVSVSLDVVFELGQ